MLFIHRPEMYQKEDSEGNSLEGTAEVIVGKHRNGPTGLVNLYFHKQFTRFDNRTERVGTGVKRADGRRAAGGGGQRVSLRWYMSTRGPFLGPPLRPSGSPASMPKSKSVYRCTECGHEHPKWVGRCEACAAWNSVAEEPAVGRTGGRSVGGRAKSGRPSASPPVRLGRRGVTSNRCNDGALGYRSSISCWVAGSFPVR